MPEEPDNLMLVYRRRIDEKVSKIAAYLGDLKVRVTNLGEGMAVLNRRVDRIEMRLDRIEGRLDLVETH